VLQLLEDMVAQGVQEKHDEEVMFARYGSFCQSTTNEKKRLIKKGNEMIEQLEADIQKNEADAELLAKEISGLDTDITTWTGDTKAATKVRQIEKMDYEKTRKDYTESMEALQEGMEVLEKENQDTQQGDEETPASAEAAAAAKEAREGGALTQFSKVPLISEDAKRAIASFLAVDGPEDADELDQLAIVSSEKRARGLKETADLLKEAGAKHDLYATRAALMQVAYSNLLPPKAKQVVRSFLDQSAKQEPAAVEQKEAKAYEAQSQGVIDMLDHLEQKFFTEREALDKKEIEDRHAFGSIQQDLKNQINFATTAREEKSVAKSKALQGAADSKGDLSDVTTTRNDDMKYLADLSATCEQKASAFEQRQKLRSGELTAVRKAIEILGSGSVAGASERNLPQLLELKKKGTSLAQLRSSSLNPTQEKAVAFLKKQGAKLGSRILATIAVRAATDPFKKVKKMVKDLIVKLMQEANDEADHKGWCDVELGTNEKTRTEKTTLVESLSAEIDELEASVAKISEDVEGLSADIADLDANLAKATAMRNTENARNTQTIKEAQDAQAAIEDAMDVLKDFYDGAAKATSLVQKGKKGQDPEIFNEPYKGMGGENGGVMGMIEVIDADFAHLESETKSQEDQSQKEFNEFSDDTKVNRAEKSSTLAHTTSKKQDQEHALQQRKGDLVGTQKELTAANEYFDKLKPSCMGGEESYEERVERRNEEIESLKEALQILQGEEV